MKTSTALFLLMLPCASTDAIAVPFWFALPGATPESKNTRVTSGDDRNEGNYCVRTDAKVADIVHQSDGSALIIKSFARESYRCPTDENPLLALLEPLSLASTPDTSQQSSNKKDDDWIKPPTFDCHSCHRRDATFIGPSWIAISTRYQILPKAKETLIAKVRDGGKGVWDKTTGGVPMPPHPDMSDADLIKVIDYILSLTMAPAQFTSIERPMATVPIALSQGKIDVPDAWEPTGFPDYDESALGLIFYAINRAADTGMILSMTRHSGITDMDKFINARRADQEHRLKGARYSAISHLKISDAPAWRFTVSGKSKTNPNQKFTFLITIIEGDRAVILVNTWTTTSNFGRQRKTLSKIAESLTGLIPPSPATAVSLPSDAITSVKNQ